MIASTATQCRGVVEAQAEAMFLRNGPSGSAAKLSSSVSGVRFTGRAQET
jgi:hypothetical protein